MASKTQGLYAKSGPYTCKDRNGKQIAGVGAKAEAGVGRVSLVEDDAMVEARGPNAGASTEISEAGVSVMTRAELAAVEAAAGPVNAKIGLGIDTGAAVKDGSVEAKVLGCGVSLGRKTSVSVFGTEIGLSFW
ncbi:hypothetical protein AGOR_G00151800 [Albula goreensis]|uniref:Uncharacterized protein n=1 Tax=Albula goreensis TaxID=1534307 RepID=A0A8T3D2L0_9TELE|nr:hypothetical protein AGOR_G00151800 [Albula goreensis]